MARNLIAATLLIFALTFLPAIAGAKTNVDLNPNLDFTQYKTFAFIGGVEHLVMMQVNPNQLRDTIHDAVSRGANPAWPQRSGPRPESRPGGSLSSRKQ